MATRLALVSPGLATGCQRVNNNTHVTSWGRSIAASVSHDLLFSRCATRHGRVEILTFFASCRRRSLNTAIENRGGTLLRRRRSKPLLSGKLRNCAYRLSTVSCWRVDHNNRLRNGIDHVIGNDDHSVVAVMTVNDDDSVKVVQDEESRKEETRAPERRGNPGIHVVVIRRRRIVCNHRWAFFVVIIVDHRGFGILRACGRLIFGVPTRSVGHNI